MGSEWKKANFGEIVQITMGQSPKGNTCNSEENGVPLLNGPTEFGNSFPKPVQFTIDPKKNAKKGDLLFCVRGSTTGRMNWADKEYAIGRGLASLRHKNGMKYQQYLKAVIAYKLPNLLLSATGSTFPNVSRSQLNTLTINIPPLPEQKAISHILGTLDEKIELNRRMNATLEQMAHTLFKSWFVDFDPVIDKALAAGNPIPEPLQKRAEKRKALGDKRKPLPENIQKLFPDAFEFSEELDKWVPKGWEVCSINEIAEVIGGGTPSTKIEEYYCQDGIPWLSPKDLSGYEWKFISKGATDITNLGLQKSSARLMPKGTVLFSSRAPIGYIAIAENEISTNQGFKSLVPKNKMASNYLFYFLKTNLTDIEAIATGSTFKEVSGSAIKNFKILIPFPNVIEHFEMKTQEFDAKQLIIQKEVKSLTNIRNTLLPKLISSEIRIPEAKTILREEANIDIAAEERANY